MTMAQLRCKDGTPLPAEPGDYYYISWNSIQIKKGAGFLILKNDRLPLELAGRRIVPWPVVRPTNSYSNYSLVRLYNRYRRDHGLNHGRDHSFHARSPLPAFSFFSALCNSFWNFFSKNGASFQWNFFQTCSKQKTGHKSENDAIK